ncbi:MAG: hypothetical protein LBU48_00895, partial [Coriobacteriales bacterium]|nr:hypothetical protein [Coriobacteriales bacterium]
PTDAIAYSGDASINTDTKADYAYTLAEVRGSSVLGISNLAAQYNDTGSFADASSYIDPTLGDGSWYTGFADGKTLRFTGLIPGKSYRIIGIPAGAISWGLGTNLNAQSVLDDGYYEDVKMPAATDPGSGVSNVELSYYDSGNKAEVEVINTNPNAQYALLEEGSGGVPDTSNPKFFWTNGGGTLTFDDLDAGFIYYLVARPLGYSEIGYADTEPYEIETYLPGRLESTDLTASQVTRAADGLSIIIPSASSNFTYAVYDPADGSIKGESRGIDGTPINFGGLTAGKTYQVVQKYYYGGTYLKGVRVYPYPTHLDADNALKIDYGANAVTNLSGGVVSHDLEYWVAPDSSPGTPAYVRAAGSSTIDLTGKLDTRSNVIYRTALIDGYVGAAVQPTQQVGYSPRPEAPLKGTDYEIDYENETVDILVGNAADYDWYDVSGNTPLTGTFSGTSIDFASLGWSGSEDKFDIRVKSTAYTFASAFREVTIAGRPAAPVLSAALNVPSLGQLRVSGLDTTEAYEYRSYSSTPGSTWTDVTAGLDEFDITYSVGNSLDVRIKATATAPSSYIDTISSPIFMNPVNFGSYVWGTAISSQTLHIYNISGADIDIDGIALTGTDATSFSLNTLTGTQTIPTAGEHNGYTITPDQDLDSGTYHATVEVTYNTNEKSTIGVSLTVTKANWNLADTDFGAPTVTDTSYSIQYNGTASVTSDMKLGWSTGGNFTNDTGATANGTWKTINGLSPATEYHIFVKALGDTNHFESNVISLGNAYTKFATPAATDIIRIGYNSETLVFQNGISPADYTVRVASSAGVPVGTVLTSGASLTAIADASDFSLEVSRNASDNFPASEYSSPLPVVGKAMAPTTGLDASKASSASAGDGAIILPGAFQYRPHMTTDETSNWTTGTNSARVTPGEYDVRIGPAGGFGSNIATITVGIKAAQTLLVDAPGTVTYGDAPTQLSTTTSAGSGQGGSASFTKTDGADSIATVSTTGLITIAGAGTIKVQASIAGDANYNAATSAELTVVIAPRDINTSDVSLTITGGPYAYTGSQIIPTYNAPTDSGANATITSSDYDISYGANINVATGGFVILTGKGNYTGTKTASFAIGKAAAAAVSFPSGLTAIDYSPTGKLLDVSLASFNSTAPNSGSFAWTSPDTKPTADVTSYSVTFTPNDAANYDYSAYGSETGYDAATGSFRRDVSLTVNKIDDPLSATPTGLTAVTGATLGAVSLPAGWVWDDALTTPVGAVGAQTFNASFAPADTVNYNARTSVALAINVTAPADKTALQAEYDAITGAAGGAGLPDIHTENYLAADVIALKAAEAAAAGVLADAFVTQVAVDAALADLTGAFNALLAGQDHPLLSASPAAELTTLGQDVTLEFKGDIRDVVGFELNGVDYPLVAGSAADTYNITEDGVVVGTISAGSAVVRLPAAFMDRFVNGTHTVRVYFADPSTDRSLRQSGSVDIVVNRTSGGGGGAGGGGNGNDPGAGPAILPATGDALPQTLLVILAVLSGASLIMLALLLLNRRGPKQARATRHR